MSTIPSGVDTQLKSWILTKDQIVNLHGILNIRNPGTSGEMYFQETYVNGEVVSGFSGYHGRSGTWILPFSQTFPAKKGDIISFRLQAFVAITSLSDSAIYANV